MDQPGATSMATDTATVDHSTTVHEGQGQAVMDVDQDTRCMTFVDGDQPCASASSVLAAPSRPPRRSAALAAQAALAQSSTDPSHDPMSVDGTSPTNAKQQPDKWHTYLARCRAESLFSSRPFRTIRARSLTLDLLAFDFVEPFVMTDPPQSIGLSIPSDFSPDLIAQHAGGTDRMLEIIDVAHQSEVRMSLADWVTYFKTPKDDRERVLNLLSLEISQQPLGKMIGRPWVVQHMDLVTRFWPSRRQRAGDMPSFQLYCLMGTEGSFTDFHVDFGGTSVFYHIIQGQKTFLFIQPTPANLRLYDAWVKADTRTRGNLAEQVSEVVEVHASAGQTLWIPSGWIHAVHTPVDSLVVGGNFLSSRYLASQISIHLMELGQSIDSKFLLPNFSDILWYTLDDFAHVPADRIDVQQAMELVHLCAFLAQHPLVGDDVTDDDDDADADGKDDKRFPLPPGDLAWGKPAWEVLRDCVQRAYRVLTLWNMSRADKVAKVVDTIVFVSMCAERDLPPGDAAMTELAKFTRVAGIGSAPAPAGSAAVEPTVKRKPGRPRKKVGAGALNGDAPGGAVKEEGTAKAKAKTKVGSVKNTVRAPEAEPHAPPVHDKPQRKSRAQLPLELPALGDLRSSPLSSLPAPASSLPASAPSPAGTHQRSARSRSRAGESQAVPELVADSSANDLSSDDLPARAPVDSVREDRMAVDALELPPLPTVTSIQGRRNDTACHFDGLVIEFQLPIPPTVGGSQSVDRDAKSSREGKPNPDVPMDDKKRSKRAAARDGASLVSESANNPVDPPPKATGHSGGPGRGRGRKSKPATDPPSGDLAFDEELIAAVSLVMPSSSPVDAVSDADEAPAAGDNRRSSARLRTSGPSKPKRSTSGSLAPPTKKRRRASATDTRASATSAPTVSTPRRRRASMSSNSSDSSCASSHAFTDVRRRRSHTGGSTSAWTTRMSQKRAEEIEAEAVAMYVAHKADDDDAAAADAVAGRDDGGSEVDPSDADPVGCVEQVDRMGSPPDASSSGQATPSGIALAASGDDAMDRNGADGSQDLVGIYKMRLVPYSDD